MEDDDAVGDEVPGGADDAAGRDDPSTSGRLRRPELHDLLDGIDTTGAQHTEALAAWQEITGPSGYLWPLALLFFTVVGGPLFGNSVLGAVISVTTAFLAVVATLRTSLDHPHRQRRLLTVAVVTWVLAVASIAVTHYTADPPEGLVTVALVLFLVLLLIALPTVLVRTLSHHRITINTLCATMCAYLIIGLTFAMAYRLYGAHGSFFAQTSEPTPGQYTYFSFITLTTVGYGDLSPGSDVARSLVMVEAIVGQVFLVTIVARVVSLLGEERRARPGAPSGD